MHMHPLRYNDIQNFTAHKPFYDTLRMTSSFRMHTNGL